MTRVQFLRWMAAPLFLAGAWSLSAGVMAGSLSLPPGVGPGPAVTVVSADASGFASLSSFQSSGTHRGAHSGLQSAGTSLLEFSGAFQGVDAFYFSRAIGERDEASRFAIGIGRLAYSAGTGYGDGRPAQQHPYSLAPSNLFHGAIDQRYRTHDLGARVALTDHSGLSLGTGTVQTDGLEDRRANFLGIDTGRLALAAFHLQRGGDTVGRGFDLRWGMGRVDLGYSELTSLQDARWQRLGLDLRLDSRRNLGVHVESRSNPLYRDAADIAMTFSFRQELGSVRRTMSGESSTAPEAGPRRGTLVLAGLGAGALAAAAVSSSGSSGSDSTARFDSQDRAASAALAAINPTSVQDNREYGGSIYRNPDASFSRSDHVRGEFKQVTFNPHAIVPKGTRATAYYHTHGRAHPDYLDEQFSTQDLQFARSFAIDGYLGTPAGRMFLYDLGADRIFQFRDASGSEFVLPN